MRSRGLGVLLGLCAAVALTPLIPWSLAAIFDGVDDRWLGSLGALEVTIPVAFGLAALILAAHGIILHQLLADELEESIDLQASRANAMLGVPAASGVVATATAVAAPASGGSQAVVPDAAAAASDEPAAKKLGGTMAVRERPAGFGSPQAEKSKADKAKRVGRRYSHRAKGAIRRKLRDNFRF